MFLPSLFILLIVKDVHWIRKLCRIYSLTSYLNENSKVYLLVLDSSCNPVSGEHSSLFRSIHLFKTRVMNESLLEDMGEITMVLILIFLWFSFVFGRLHIYMSTFTLEWLLKSRARLQIWNTVKRNRVREQVSGYSELKSLFWFACVIDF